MTDRKSGQKRVLPPIPITDGDASGAVPDSSTEPTGVTDSFEIILDGTSYSMNQRSLSFMDHIARGQYGQVDKMLHKLTGHLLAVKKIRYSSESSNKLLNDLHVSQRSRDCEYVLVAHGAFKCNTDLEVWIIMELMDCSMERLNSLRGPQRPFPEVVLAFISYAVVTALEHLHQVKVMHRDVKPSNMLVDRTGQVKICDFGISGEMENSLAQSNIGTNRYLAPERIKADESQLGFPVQSDVWSLGLSILELVLGQYPYPAGLKDFQLLMRIAEKEAPQLSREQAPQYTEQLREFVNSCLVKDRDSRPNYMALMARPFYTNVQPTTAREEMAAFVQMILPELAG